jgi:hypothetical protein
MAAVSTSAIHNIATGKKKFVNSGFSDITNKNLLAKIHSQIPTHNQVNHIANHAQIDKYGDKSRFDNN